MKKSKNPLAMVKQTLPKVKKKRKKKADVEPSVKDYMKGGM